MIKKVNVKQLQPGMYVHDFDSGWMDHPFFRKQILIKDDKTIQKIVEAGIHKLYIDTDKGLDVSHAPTAAEARLESLRELKQQQSHPQKTNLKEIQTVSLAQEMEKAKEVKKEARNYIGKVFKTIQSGENLVVEDVYPVIDNLVESIHRNGDALISLLRVKDKDEYTYLHSISVGTLLAAFGKFLNFEDDQIRAIGVGGILHDIGKTETPLSILNKPGRLTENEFKKMRNHVVKSRLILEEYHNLDPVVLQVASEHHERFDGTGYPNKTKGDEISLGGQMAAIIDVYDALTSDRVYHKGKSPDQAIRKMYEWSKYHFNQELVHKFISFMGLYPIGSVVKLDNNMLGVVVQSHGTAPVVRVLLDYKRRVAVRPRNIDLSSIHGKNTRITGTEDPTNWRIDVGAILEGNT